MTINAMASAEMDFTQGMAYFKDKNYQLAVDYFESAQEKGLKSISLDYNLASSYYKLKNYSKSEYYFLRVEAVKSMRSLARYNLGLVTLKKNEPNKAKQYFELVLTDDNVKLTELARRQLSDLNVLIKPWSIYVSADVGYDDNITAAPGETALEASDTFYDVLMSADYLVSGQRKDGWLVNASYFKIDYLDNDNYDEYQYGIGMRREKNIFAWDGKISLNINQYNYAGIDYQSTIKFDMRMRRVISKTERIYLRYRYEDISSEDVIYNYLEGWRQRTRIEYRNYKKKNIQQIYYELELNDRNDLVATTYSYDYSPTRHTVRGKYTYILSSQWDLTGDISYRYSDFPASVSFDRNDDRWRLALLADYRIDKTLKIKTRLQMTDNRSSVDQYDYDKNSIISRP